MNFEITIGQYYPTDSIIHRLDARVKLILTLIFIVIVCLVNNFIGYLFSVIFVLSIIKLSKVPVKLLLKSLKSIFFIVFFTFILNIFIIPGDTVLFQIWIAKISVESLLIASRMVIRLTVLVMASSLLTLTSSPIQLTDAIEHLLHPFKKIGVPSHQIAMMMTITLRFIPTLIEEMEKIVKAQKARGADFETGGIIKKAKALIPVLVPLFLSSFRRADELATAMEARCYRGDVERTKMKEMKFHRNDFYAGLIATVANLIILSTSFLHM